MSSHKQEDIHEEKWDLLNPENISCRPTINIVVMIWCLSRCYRSSGMWQIDSFMKAMCEVDASKFLQ
ncbi:hypothetical protein Patl1_03804 [Pistacia atlantica]|uniref:Uncharacterized protein n=1 Tax=Pistacia atlantica TaxID=434234 RepID=A0ACC1BQY7_9ROSI|nr:hypothetical protein Patl1_03804 [Pistacia atlantica]